MNIRTPKGAAASFSIRGDTNDGALINGILSTDEYKLTELGYFKGWGLDIGAHVGTVAISMALDNPDLRMVAVEPVPENCDMLRHTISANGLPDRVFVEQASLGKPGQATLPCRYAYTYAAAGDAGYVEQNRYVGNLWREDGEGTYLDAPVVTLDSLAQKYETPSFAFTKIDCEGCEWAGLAKGVERLEFIVGEWHDKPFSAVGRLLRKTHDVELLTDYGGSGIFRAIRR